MTFELTIQRLLNEIGAKLRIVQLNGRVGRKNIIRSSKVNIPGLELAGYWDFFSPKSLQILTHKEVKFISTISATAMKSIFQRMFAYEIPAVILLKDLEIPPLVVDLATDMKIPLLQTKVENTDFLKEINSFLYKEFAPRINVHGTLLDIYGVGVLLTGRSGIGKSEIALDLIERGHRLVADDVVNIEKTSETILMGYGEKILQNTLEIRGLGVVNVRKAFGIRAVRPRKRLEVQIELVEWDSEIQYERFGLDEQKNTILDVDIPFITLPIYPGKNITVIAEVIALNYMLKLHGEDPAKELQEELMNKLKLQASTMNDKRFKGDFE
jgi:HPr kinase/phosphorylase